MTPPYNEVLCAVICVQDWWNLVVWDSPHLVHFLDCTYNYQTNTLLNKEPWTEVFPSYHHCEGEVRIMHGHDV